MSSASQAPAPPVLPHHRDEIEIAPRPRQDARAAEELEGIDLFDRLQLAGVIKVCRESRTLSEAGRTLFGSSRERKKIANDADRLRKYLARFSLSWDQLKF